MPVALARRSTRPSTSVTTTLSPDFQTLNAVPVTVIVPAPASTTKGWLASWNTRK
ncbi:Uncharacterised protein [Bordetella pertussis]|nr:Uncharacterised protein [Bordetella pertussis]